MLSPHMWLPWARKGDTALMGYSSQVTLDRSSCQIASKVVMFVFGCTTPGVAPLNRVGGGVWGGVGWTEAQLLRALPAVREHLMEIPASTVGRSQMPVTVSQTSQWHLYKSGETRRKSVSVHIDGSAE